jgi:hypothetical protein
MEHVDNRLLAFFRLLALASAGSMKWKAKVVSSRNWFQLSIIIRICFSQMKEKNIFLFLHIGLLRTV